MKRNLLLTLCLALCALGAYSKIKVAECHPEFWWTGMQEKQLQIMLYGENIASCDIDVSYPGVKVEKAVKLDSPNYIFLYLNVSDAAQPGKFDIQLTRGKEKMKQPFELRKRDMTGDAHKGFDASDVLYLIMPDRFADGDQTNNVVKGMRFPTEVNRNNPNARHGGDLQGIEQNLDYIKDLGITAIWLNPVMENDMPGGSYHGYATTNYYKVDQRFGTNEYYKNMIAKCHNMGMKVVMDMIFNHCGSEHIWALDPPSKDWFNFQNDYHQTNYRTSTVFDPHASEYDKQLSVEGWFVKNMPDLNQHNEHLMKYLTQNSIWWVEYANIDGIRMDTYPYVFFDSMAKWCEAVSREYPNYNSVGECWLNSSAGCAFWQAASMLHKQNSHLKSVMDFPLSIMARNAFEGDTNGSGGLDMIYDHMALDFQFPNYMDLLTFLDNHDTDRFLRQTPKDLGYFKQALAFILTARGTPQIYYGTEILMSGDKKGSDGFVRRDFPGGFPGDNTNEFVASGRTPMQNDAWDFIKTICNWRKNCEPIAKGSMKHFIPNNGLYVYSRSYNGKNIAVMMNGKDSETVVDMNRYSEIMSLGKTYKDIITGNEVSVSSNMTFAPRALYIFEY